MWEGLLPSFRRDRLSKVLLVDDDERFLNLYKRFLVSTNHEVETAFNGEEALDKLTSFRPEIIFLDYVMPEMNGLEFLLRLQCEPELKDIPVVVLTAYGDSLGDCFEFGAKGLLHKGSFKWEEMLKRIAIFAG